MKSTLYQNILYSAPDQPDLICTSSNFVHQFTGNIVVSFMAARGHISKNGKRFDS